MMHVIGVCKRYHHSTKSKMHPRAKKFWAVYFLDDFFKLHVKRISFMQVAYYKVRIKSRKYFVCQACGHKFLFVVKKNTKSVPCPNGCDDQ